MNIKKWFLLILISALLLGGCDYIVVPEEDAASGSGGSGWGGMVTGISETGAGDLHVDITIRNDNADWSAMQATGPATLTAKGGKSSACDTVLVSTGEHRLAPGFQMRGYTGGTKAEPKVQMLYVECKGVDASPGSKLSFDYTYYTGVYNFYDPEAHKASGKMELSLDQVVKDATYPVGKAVDGLVQKSGAQIKAINDCVLTLTGVTQTGTGLQFAWQTTNPGEYPSYVHIGNPPVIGEDGIIYGLYESPHLASVPLTGAGKTAEWTTEVSVPKEAKGLYILLSVESPQQRYFTNYAVKIE